MVYFRFGSAMSVMDDFYLETFLRYAFSMIIGITWLKSSCQKSILKLLNKFKFLLNWYIFNLVQQRRWWAFYTWEKKLIFVFFKITGVTGLISSCQKSSLKPFNKFKFFQYWWYIFEFASNKYIILYWW